MVEVEGVAEGLGEGALLGGWKSAGGGKDTCRDLMFLWPNKERERDSSRQTKGKGRDGEEERGNMVPRGEKAGAPGVEGKRLQGPERSLRGDRKSMSGSP